MQVMRKASRDVPFEQKFEEIQGAKYLGPEGFKKREEQIQRPTRKAKKQYGWN